MATLTPTELAQAMALREEGMSWRLIGIALHRDRRTCRDELVALGYPSGAIGLHTRPGRPQVRPTPRRKAITCFIGNALSGPAFCSQRCELDDGCLLRVTLENLEAFIAFAKRRRQIANADAERAKERKAMAKTRLGTYETRGEL